MRSAMLCRYDIETPMRDGVILRGDLYLPEAQGRYPLLLWRTIFRKDTLARAFGQYDPAYFVRRGYGVFVQDARGLGASDGAFDRFTADGKDGYDTIEWLAEQPYSDGNIGMIGNYYAGYLQLMAAAERPPHLRAICPFQTSVSVNRDCDNRGFLFASHIGWCMSRQISRLRDGRYDERTTSRYLPMLLDELRAAPTRQLRACPLRDMKPVKDTPFPIFRDYMRHLVDGYDDLALMHKEGRDMDLRSVATPAFYVAGWYDSSRNALIAHCKQQRSVGVDSRVLVAPWKPGEQPARADSALENGEVAVDIQAQIVAWFDHWLKGGEAPPWKPYRYYDIATGDMWAGDEWSDGAGDCLYLHQGGRMDSQPQGEDEPSDGYTLDPAHPLPYVPYGAAGKLEAGGDDMLHYLTDPLADELPLCGMASAKLYLSSDRADTDAMLKLCDVGEDGSVFVICDGATRARYRNGWTSEPLTPGEVYPLDVLLGRVKYTVRAGHRLLLTVTGSAFPKYDVNHGTARRPADDTEWLAARNAVHHSARYPSKLCLPVWTNE